MLGDEVAENLDNQPAHLAAELQVSLILLSLRHRQCRVLKVIEFACLPLMLMACLFGQY